MSIIRVLATDLDTGEAISNARVDIENVETGESFRVCTNDEGMVVINVRPGQYTFDLRSRVYEHDYNEWIILEGEEAEVDLKARKKRRYR